MNFPDNLNRAKRNTRDIFPELIGERVKGVETVKYDRSVFIQFDSHRLLLKMHGRRGNVVLFDGLGEVEDVFIQSIAKDYNLEFDKLGKQLPEKDIFIERNGEMERLFPVLGKKLIGQLYLTEYLRLSLEKKWVFFQEYIHKLESLDHVFINGEGEELALELVESKGKSVRYEDPVKAMNDFFYQKVSFDSLHLMKTQLLREGEKRLIKLKNYVLNLKYKLDKLEKEDFNKYHADVIMSQIYQLKGKTLHEVVLTGFKGESIKLNFRGKPATSVAENLYRKSKNKQIEVDTIKKNIRIKKLEINIWEAELKEIQESTDARKLKLFQKEKVEKEIPHSPFHRFEKDGFVILVGKNSRNNDELTFKNSFKDDLWLHAKDVPGSHVLIKYKSGQNFPKPVIEYAAGLAAYYSKRKTESLVPVTITPRKYVRKRKGDPPGMVVVEKEEVILASPQY